MMQSSGDTLEFGSVRRSEGWSKHYASRGYWFDRRSDFMYLKSGSHNRLVSGAGRSATAARRATRPVHRLIRSAAPYSRIMVAELQSILLGSVMADTLHYVSPGTRFHQDAL